MNKQIKPVVLAILATFTLSAQALTYDETVVNGNITGDPDIQIGKNDFLLGIGIQVASYQKDEFSLDTQDKGIINVLANQTGVDVSGNSTLSIGSELTDLVNVQINGSRSSALRAISAINSPDFQVNVNGKKITLSTHASSALTQTIFNSGEMYIGSENTESLIISANSEPKAAYAISNNNGAVLELAGKVVEITADSTDANATAIQNSNSTFEINSADTVSILANAANGQGTGVNNINGGNTTVIGNNITIEGTDVGVLNNASSFNAGNEHTERLTIKSTAQNGRGLETNSAVTTVLLGKNIELNGGEYGLLNKSSEVSIGSDVTESINVTATSTADQVVGIYSSGSNEVTLSAGKVTIESSQIGILGTDTCLNTNAQNISIFGEEEAIHNEGSTIVIGKLDSEYVQIHSTSEDSVGVSVGVGGTTSIAGQNVAISAVDSGLFAVEGSIKIDAENLNVSALGDSGQALVAQGNDENMTKPEQRTSLIISATNTQINAAQGTGITATSYGLVDVSGNLIVNAEQAIYARGNATVNINQEGNSTVILNGNIGFGTPGSDEESGEIIDAKVNVNLTGEGSSWTGNAYKSYLNEHEGDSKYTDVTGFNVTLADGAQWNPTVIEGGSTETNTTAAQSINVLDFNDGVINANFGKEQEVKVDKTTGTGGTVNFLTTANADGTLTAAKVDFGTTEESLNLAINYTGITADDLKGKDLSVIDGGVTNEKIARTEHVGQGAVLGAVTETYNAEGERTSRTVAENTRLDAYGSVAALSIMQWRHEMNDLTKRMGELRTSPEGVGSWARIYGSEQEYGSQNLTAKNTSVQIGADTDIGNGWKVGAAFTYTDGSADYDLGDADNKAYGLGIYGTWMADNGQFVDLIAKYSRLDTDFKLEGMNGSSNNNAFSVSAEYGWHLRLGEFGFFEPQAEVTYGYIQGDKFHTSNGVEIDQDDFESLIGRIGFRTGFHFPKDKGLIYARVSGLHDFKGDFDSTATLMSDRSIYDNIGEDLGDTWVEFGIGANFNWTPNTYTYVDLERTNGGDVKENWRWSIGLRHVF